MSARSPTIDRLEPRGSPGSQIEKLHQEEARWSKLSDKLDTASIGILPFGRFLPTATVVLEALIGVSQMYADRLSEQAKAERDRLLEKMEQDKIEQLEQRVKALEEALRTNTKVVPQGAKPAPSPSHINHPKQVSAGREGRDRLEKVQSSGGWAALDRSDRWSRLA